MKFLSILSLLFLLVSCGTETVEETSSCLERLDFAGYGSFKEGAESATERREVTYTLKAYPPKFEKERFFDSAKVLDACTLVCKEGHTKYAVSGNINSAFATSMGYSFPDGGCVPNAPTCKKILFSYSRFTNDLKEMYSYVDDPTCEESCSEGYSKNSSTTPHSCVETVTECTIEDLGADALSGTKTWSESTNSYSSCMISSCRPGYELNENQCTRTQEAISGCTAPNAANYNPTATENDGSCSCPPGTAYEAIANSCVEQPEPECPPGQVFNPNSMECELN